MKKYYFDNMATTPLYDEVVEEISNAMKNCFANPSSAYILGQKSRKKIEDARYFISNHINAERKEIFFTSAATEATNWAFKIALNNTEKKHIITTQIEHHSVLNVAGEYEKNGYDVTYLKCNKYGEIDIKDLELAIKEDTALISVMYVNNEIGTVLDVKKVGEIAKKNNIIFHCDAVQALKYFKVDVKELNADLVSFSAHKLNAPKGIGALYINSRLKTCPFIYGGHQELDMRAGTENLYGIVGFHKALEIISANKEEIYLKTKEIQEYFINKVLDEIDDSILNGSKVNRHPANCHFSFKGIDSNILLLLLDEKNIYCSAGSACSSGFVGISHVLKAINVDDNYVNGSLRFSIDENTTREDVDYVVSCLKEIIEKLRS